MAKGNLFLGVARGRVGDVTMFRQNGQQVTRVINKNIKNPRTQAQMVQRAFLSTVGKAYSLMSKICDHSFQGKSVGAENQRRFLSLNLRKWREQWAGIELGSGSFPLSAYGVAPFKSTGTPIGDFTISEGSLAQSLYVVNQSYGNGEGATSAMPAVYVNGYDDIDATGKTPASLGLVSGDIYTICILHAEVESDPEIFKAANFGFMRLIVKDELPSTIKNTTTLSEVFDIDEESTVTLPASTFFKTVLTLDMFTASSASRGAMAVIRSRKDSGQRSNAAFSTGAFFGLGLEEYLAGLNEETIGNSDLILEGGSF